MTAREVRELQTSLSQSEGATFTSALLAGGGTRQDNLRSAMAREEREMEGGEKTKKKSKKHKKRTKSSQEASQETSQEPTRKKSRKEKKRDKTSEESEEQLRAEEQLRTEPARKKKTKKDKKRNEDKISHPPGPSCVPQEPAKEKRGKKKEKSRHIDDEAMAPDQAGPSRPMSHTERSHYMAIQRDARPKYRALAETSSSEDEDEEYLPGQSLDEDEESDLFIEGFWSEGEEEEAQADEEDEDDDDQVKEQQARPAKRQRKKKTNATPAADNDPREAGAGAVLDEDVHQWSSQLRRVFTHPFAGPTPPGPTFPKQAGMRAVDYFLKFFSLALFSFIAEMTNINLQLANIEHRTSTAEIRAWFGIHMIMGLTRIANAKDYWSTRPGFRNDLIAKTMTRARFNVLASHLACSDPGADPKKMPSTTTEEKQAKFNYIRSHQKFYFKTLWDNILANCRTKYNCRKHLAIDEAMIPYRGFRAWCQKVFMPCKPIRAGFKVYAMAESSTGYICDFVIHTHSKTPKKMVDIAMSVAASHLDRFHHIFTDKLYTSRDLANQLLQRGTYLTGAIKMNSARLPLDLSANPKKNSTNLAAVQNIRKTPRGTFYARQSGQLTYTLWNDSSLLSTLSSAHSAFRDPARDFVERRYTIEGAQARQAHRVPAPPAVIDYCQHMGGVDRADQLRSYHAINRKSQDWWKQVVYFLVDICRVNGWLCYKQHLQQHLSDGSEDDTSYDESGPLNHCHFTMDVAEQLIQGYAHGSKTKRQPKTPRVPLHNFGGLHSLVYMGAKFPKGCKQCARDKKKTPSGFPVKTHFGCAACGVHLCTSYCFPRYHAISGIPVAEDPDTDN
ncbi:piggyBac transposable element-derived protein 4-like [Patiria miniata]|uniref:PiggyBac transposable element-derived protein domain-containing protein n=1 Tax=Patiria miniata TaxID=46514 RepID=A0A913ZWF2_PATMI|nr:piggyBac transposable element-derived protein 4-like [Patiria miniata]